MAYCHRGVWVLCDKHHILRDLSNYILLIIVEAFGYGMDWNILLE